jgi:hypothetical protein
MLGAMSDLVILANTHIGAGNVLANQPNTTERSTPRRAARLLVLAGLVLTGCGSGDTASPESALSAPSMTAESPAADSETATADPATDAVTAEPATVATDDSATVPGERASLVAEVWADNWFALYVNGELVGEDSVPITTERSFNAETITFEASFPLTIAIEAKDFKETDSGIEYIGLDNQQMGDGGLIAQIADVETGAVVATTSADWSTLVIHRAPLNTECEKDSDPDATCEFESIEAPVGWTETDFDAGDWEPATEWLQPPLSNEQVSKQFLKRVSRKFCGLVVL